MGPATRGPAGHVNHSLYRYWIFVKRQPSSNKTIATYYESNKATSNYPQYAALEMEVDRSVSTSYSHGNSHSHDNSNYGNNHIMTAAVVMTTTVHNHGSNHIHGTSYTLS